MEKLQEIRQEYLGGALPKHEYIEKMYESCHASLFEYAQYLTNTNIRKIEIDDGRIIMTTRNRGIKMLCVPDDHRLAPIETLNFLDYEPTEVGMVEQLFSGCKTFFDVGANIGYYALNISAAYRDAEIHCFEPIPTTFGILSDNLLLNHKPTIKPYNFGLSDKSGSFPFYYYPEGSGNASAENLTQRQDVSVINCQIKTLDEVVSEQLAQVDFIKCDVEGGELLVFKGALRTLNRDKPIVFSEILRKWSAKFGYDSNEIFSLFESLGYRAFVVRGQRLEAFHRVDSSTVDTNFFFLHSEKHQEKIARYTSVSTS